MAAVVKPMPVPTQSPAQAGKSSETLSQFRCNPGLEVSMGKATTWSDLPVVSCLLSASWVCETGSWYQIPAPVMALLHASFHFRPGTVFVRLAPDVSQ